MRFPRFHLLLLALVFALEGSGCAQEIAKPTSSTAEAAAFKKLLETKFPGGAISNVGKSLFFGLSEAQFDDRLIYTDAKVTYVMVGSVFNADTKENLTDARWRKLTRVSWDSLPLQLAFKRVRGNGTRRMAIFADADCPFCRKLEGDLRKLDDVTIYTFLYPIDSLHPDSSRKSAMLWCAEDRGKAWDEFFASGK